METLFTYEYMCDSPDGSEYTHEFHGCVLKTNISRAANTGRVSRHQDERCVRGTELALICKRADGVYHGFDDCNRWVMDIARAELRK